MAKRWSAEDIRDLETLAQEYSVQAIAEKIDRTVVGWPSRRTNWDYHLRRDRRRRLGSSRILIGPRATTHRLRQTNVIEASLRP